MSTVRSLKHILVFGFKNAPFRQYCLFTFLTFQMVHPVGLKTLIWGQPKLLFTNLDFTAGKSSYYGKRVKSLVMQMGFHDFCTYFLRNNKVATTTTFRVCLQLKLNKEQKRCVTPLNKCEKRSLAESKKRKINFHISDRQRK